MWKRLCVSPLSAMWQSAVGLHERSGTTLQHRRKSSDLILKRNCESFYNWQLLNLDESEDIFFPL